MYHMIFNTYFNLFNRFLDQIPFRNAIKVLGFEVIDIVTPEDIETAKMIIFPGVGSFGQAIKVRNKMS